MYSSPSVSSELKYYESSGTNDLSFSKIKGDTRYNFGKQAEIRERVKHV